jgi:alpha-tubulin suppressor-like RCC1 family protein
VYGRASVLLALGLAACGGAGTATTSTGTGGATASSSSGTGGAAASVGSGGAGGAPVDECADGTAVCSPDADCVDTPAYYTCTCKPGYQGDGKTCADVDECQTLLAECDPHADCTNTPGSYTCACPAGLVGDGKACRATYTSITAGQYHACAVRSEGTAWCWGLNTSGQIGTGTSDPVFLRPAQAGSGSDWKQLAAGAAFTCGLDGAQQISCWGTGSLGQIGDGTTVAKSSPTPIAGGFSDWIALEAGTTHACAIRAGGAVYCWGSNTRGQIGDGTTTNQSQPTPVGAGPWLSVSAGSEHTCAVGADHTLWCWGLDTSRQLGDGKTTNSSVPVQEKTLGVDWASVSAGNAYTCGVKLDGSRWCWGSNTLGQGGDGTTTAILQPKAGDPATDWARVDAGDFAACGLRTGGALWCWGDGSAGQTGQPGAEALLPAPAQVGTDTDWTAIASGLRFGCGLRADGRITCWGAASQAATGLGYSSDRQDPTPVGAATDWERVDAQLDDGCGIRANGDLYCWGRNAFSELGDGTGVTRVAPVQVGAGKPWKRVAVGRTHTCGIATTGGLDGVLCWGADGNGEQGNGAGTTSQVTPSPITAPAGVPTGWTEIAAGFNHTCAVGTDKTLWCWGRNASGQLGDGTTTSRSDPKRVLPAGAADWVDVAASGDFTCGLRGAGTLWCWGLNTSGQVGEGDVVSPVNAPVQIGVATYTAVSAGATHACAVATDGTLWCWGVNSSGQLGLGDTSVNQAPVQVGVATDWARPLLGQGTSTCALRTGGALWCWGSGYDGQLGVGSLKGFNTPQLVPSLTGWKTASVGLEHACGVGADGRLRCWGASYAAQLGDGAPFVSTPTAIVEAP